MTPEQRLYIKDGYMNTTKFVKELALDVGVTPGAATSLINRMLKSGEIPCKRGYAISNKNKRPKRVKARGDEAPKDGNTVNCTSIVARKCIYGTSLGTCNYLSITGQSRRSQGYKDPHCCGLYVKADKEHPKLTAREDYPYEKY